MRALKSKNQGFTLIETMIVLAISAALAIGLLSSYTVNQRRSRFTDAIERVVSTLERVKQEANSAYTTGSGGVGSNMQGNRVFFGKAISFNNNQSIYTIDIMTADRSDELANVDVEDPSQTTQSIPWGVACVCGTPYRYVDFIRMPGSTQLTLFLRNDQSINSGVYQTPSIAQTNLIFRSPDNLCARVTVNASTGEISREYDYNDNVC